jgi:hypothetical protein
LYIPRCEVFLLRVSQERMGRIDRRDSMSTSRQVASYPAFTTANLKGASTRRGNDEIEEAVPEIPVRVVARGASPAKPILGFRLPLRFPSHGQKLGRA